MSNIKFKGNIRKALLNGKNHLKVKFIEHRVVENEPVNSTLAGGWDQPVHKDLTTAFKVLLGHAAVIAGLLPKGKEVDGKYFQQRKCVVDPELSIYEVKGFEYKKETEESKKVTLFIEKSTPRGGILMQLPEVELYSGSDYDFSGNLADDLADCEIEIAKYMDGKFFDYGQGNLFVNVEGDVVAEKEEF